MLLEMALSRFGDGGYWKRGGAHEMEVGQVGAEGWWVDFQQRLQLC